MIWLAGPAGGVSKSISGGGPHSPCQAPLCELVCGEKGESSKVLFEE